MWLMHTWRSPPRSAAEPATAQPRWRAKVPWAGWDRASTAMLRASTRMKSPVFLRRLLSLPYFQSALEGSLGRGFFLLFFVSRGSSGWARSFEIRQARRSEEHTSELQSRFDLVC